MATAVAAEAEAPPQPKFRKDYQPLPYCVETVHLDFDLREEHATITSTLRLTPNPRAAAAAQAAAGAPPPPLILNGRDDLELVSVRVDGAPLAAGPATYTREPALLTLHSPPAAPSFELEVVTRTRPQDNSLLEGLYKSGGNFSTQCEAEGFRGITFFPDRPDVMARYTTRVEADAEKYPVLLSNGDLAESGPCPEPAKRGRHYATWVDPFPKPCYLFALVAGDLVVKEDAFVTRSGKRVALRIYTQPQSIAQVGWAMESLKASMRWDEEAFGLEYDLGLFNIVAVDDFNMGAMENKSLNIFNSRLVLADKDTSSDGDYARIQGVVGHEYFHNWTGERERERARAFFFFFWAPGGLGSVVLAPPVFGLGLPSVAQHSPPPPSPSTPINPPSHNPKQTHHPKKKATASRAATGSSSRSRRASPSTATRSFRPTSTRAASSASRTRSACARRSLARTAGRWRTPCGPTATSRWTTFTRSRCTRRAPRSCACTRRSSGARASGAAWTCTLRGTTARP